MPHKAITLNTLQNQFADYVYQKATVELPAFIASRGDLQSEDLLGIYRNNTLGLLKENLELIYPTVLAIVGEEFFKTLAYHYIPLNPSKSGDMHEYGENFADFISHFPAAESLPYLPDIARLEWRWHQVYHAADNQDFDVATLASVAAENFDRLFFKLIDASALVQSDYPILKIWQISQPNTDSELTVNLDDGGQNIVMLRVQGTIYMHSISDAEVLFIENLAEAYSFTQAYEKTAAEYEFDINTSLQKIIQFGLIADCYVSQN